MKHQKCPACGGVRTEALVDERLTFRGVDMLLEGVCVLRCSNAECPEGDTLTFEQIARREEMMRSLLASA